tara:strand:+ start:3146 stop:3559 length:414 start_codon:yes stop_codon:yes gene_type:complete
MIDKIHKLEEATVLMLNKFDGWDLNWTGEGFTKWDAEGLTPKGQECVMEMKFRNKHYPDKMLEKDKYDALIATGKVAIYFVSDPKGTYVYWLNNLELPPLKEMYCPDTTMWTKKKINKPVYLLNEDLAALKILKDET